MSKPYELGMIVGRFQTITNGHIALLSTAEALCEHIILFVGSAQESGTARNPLSVATRMTLLDKVVGDNFTIIGLDDLTSNDNNSPSWGNYLFENCKKYTGKLPNVTILGKEENVSNWYDKDSTQKITEVNVARSDISATYARELMVANKVEKWKSITPEAIHSYYDIIRKELMEVDYYKELENTVYLISSVSENEFLPETFMRIKTEAYNYLKNKNKNKKGEKVYIINEIKDVELD